MHTRFTKNCAGLTNPFFFFFLIWDSLQEERWSENGKEEKLEKKDR